MKLIKALGEVLWTMFKAMAMAGFFGFLVFTYLDVVGQWASRASIGETDSFSFKFVTVAMLAGICYVFGKLYYIWIIKDEEKKDGDE